MSSKKFVLLSYAVMFYHAESPLVVFPIWQRILSRLIIRLVARLLKYNFHSAESKKEVDLTSFKENQNYLFEIHHLMKFEYFDDIRITTTEVKYFSNGQSNNQWTPSSHTACCPKTTHRFWTNPTTGPSPKMGSPPYSPWLRANAHNYLLSDETKRLLPWLLKLK